MPIIVLPNKDKINNLNFLINKYSKNMEDIEYLLSNAPKKYEIYDATVNVLKDLKRGVPRKTAIDEICLMLCPNGEYRPDNCAEVRCSDCWSSYIDKVLLEAENKDNKN